MSISALVLAQKVWDDTPLINADFSILYPALNVKEINFLERKFLDLLEFKVGPFVCRSGPRSAAVCAHVVSAFFAWIAVTADCVAEPVRPVLL